MPVLPYKNGKAIIDNAELEYIDFGRGEPLLIIPGLGDGLQTIGSTAPVFYLFSRGYSRYFRVIVMSRRDPLPPGFTTKDMADDYAGAMASLGITRYGVMGISQGGMIAQHLAADYPQRVAKLVLAIAHAKPDRGLVEILDSWIRMVEERRYGDLSVDTMEKTYTGRRLSRYRLLYPVIRRMGKPKSDQRFIVHAEAIQSHDARDKLSRIVSPTLVIGAAQDRIINLSLVKEMAGAIKGSELIVFEDSGHGVYEEKRKRFEQAVMEFLLGTDPRKA